MLVQLPIMLLALGKIPLDLPEA